MDRGYKEELKLGVLIQESLCIFYQKSKIKNVFIKENTRSDVPEGIVRLLSERLLLIYHNSIFTI